MTNLVNSHYEKALNAFHAAVANAEKQLMSVSKSSSFDEAKVLIELAELHLLAHETMKAEEEFTKALGYFNRCTDEHKDAYIVYVLKKLSGIHECLRRRKEAKAELVDAMILEEKLKKAE